MPASTRAEGHHRTVQCRRGGGVLRIRMVSVTAGVLLEISHAIPTILRPA
jgi:hypothetical protein